MLYNNEGLHVTHVNAVFLIILMQFLFLFVLTNIIIVLPSLWNRVGYDIYISYRSLTGTSMNQKHKYVLTSTAFIWTDDKCCQHL